MKRLVVLAALTAVATACGGGGGGGGDSSWLTFTPSPISVSVVQGESVYVSLTGTARSVPDRVVNPAVVLDGAAFRVISPPTYDGDMSYAMLLETVPTLTLGAHDGNIEVRVCEDDPRTCARPFRGSPWRVPYHIDVVGEGANTALDFEGDQVARWTAAGLLVPNDGELDHTLPDVTITRDTALFQAGDSSLKIVGPVVKNYWGSNATESVTDVRAYLNPDRSYVNFTGRTLSVYFHLGAGTETVDCVEVQLIDTAGRPWQGKYTNKTGETWQHVTFTPGVDEDNYKRPEFDVTRVQSIVLRISSGTGPVTRAEWNVDSITW